MWGFDHFGLSGTADGSIAVPVWLAASTAALVFLLLLLAAFRRGSVAIVALVAVVVIGVAGAWSWLEHERSVERRALEERVRILEGQALAPGSVLACLDASAGEQLENGCEKMVFGTPENSAAALVYVGSRFALLTEAVDRARRDTTLESLAQSLRGSLEQDRFGVLAQVLIARHGCTFERCEQFRLLRDPNRVRSHMRERTFETVLARHAPNWPSRPGRPGAPVAGLVASPVPSQYSLPSAASIPPVSIISGEPGAEASSGAPASTGSTDSPPPAAPPSQARRSSSRPAQTRQQPSAPGAPVQLAPQQRAP